MKHNEPISFTDVEWRVMRALWALEEPSLGQILKEVADAGWSKHAVISFLKRLEAKGALTIDTRRRPPRYIAAIPQEAAQQHQAREVLDKVYGGDLLLMVSNAVNAGPLSAEETQTLINILKKGG
jgi:BlaI family penicillinase repressor